MSISIIPMLLKEMEQEAQTTRKMLSCIPDDKFSWKPHEKSMSIKQLATQPYEPTEVNITTELLDLFERSLATPTKHN